jgi:hypothetical protein
MVFRRHRAGWVIGAGTLHQVLRRGPVGMAVEQCADNPAVQHAGKRLVMGFSRSWLEC